MPATGLPPTRLLSWRQLVIEADPQWLRESLQPWVFEFSNGRLFVDTLPTYTPFADGLINDGGVLILDAIAGIWPESPVGLVPGSFYSNGGVVTIVSGFTPVARPPVYFLQTGAVQLLASNGIGLPVTPPPKGSGQIWNGYGGNEVWVA
jgi:hypothetical protein